MAAHHPSDDIVMRCAAGTLDAGARLVVETHIEYCQTCARRVSAAEAIGGAYLCDLPPEPMNPQVLSQALAVLDEWTPPRVAKQRPRPDWPAGVAWPSSLSAVDIHPWRRLAPGVQWAEVRVDGPSDQTVFLLRAKSGKVLPRHGHTGPEYTCVLAGSFSDARGCYGPGDMAEVDDDYDHQVVAGPEADCICLIAVTGRLRPHGWINRLLQPFIGL
jgi:putative transcriptional regulator